MTLTLPPRARTLLLAVHVVLSVGWLGAAGVFFAIGLVLGTRDPATAHTVYQVLVPVTWSVVVPLSLLTLVTGVVQALATRWGLVRHYWVLLKLLINAVGVVVLLSFAQNLTQVADTGTGESGLVEHSGGGLVLLVTAALLGILKPRGTTRAGRRDRQRVAH